MASRKAMRTSRKRAAAIVRVREREIVADARAEMLAQMTARMIPDEDGQVFLTPHPERPRVVVADMPRTTVYTLTNAIPLSVRFRTVTFEPVEFAMRLPCGTLVRWHGWRPS